MKMEKEKKKNKEKKKHGHIHLVETHSGRDRICRCGTLCFLLDDDMFSAANIILIV